MTRCCGRPTVGRQSADSTRFDAQIRLRAFLIFGGGNASAVMRTNSARNSGSSRSAIKNQFDAPGNGGASIGVPSVAHHLVPQIHSRFAEHALGGDVPRPTQLLTHESDEVSI